MVEEETSEITRQDDSRQCIHPRLRAAATSSFASYALREAPPQQTLRTVPSDEDAIDRQLRDPALGCPVQVYPEVGDVVGAVVGDEVGDMVGALVGAQVLDFLDRFTFAYIGSASTLQVPPTTSALKANRAGAQLSTLTLTLKV